VKISQKFKQAINFINFFKKNFYNKFNFFTENIYESNFNFFRETAN